MDANRRELMLFLRIAQIDADENRLLKNFAELALRASMVNQTRILNR
jgi:hypothetical protein